MLHEETLSFPKTWLSTLAAAADLAAMRGLKSMPPSPSPQSAFLNAP